jgi:hypothetical protein
MVLNKDRDVHVDECFRAGRSAGPFGVDLERDG